MLENIPRLYTGFAEWISCITVIFVSKKRFNKIITIFISTGFLILLIFFQIFAGTIPIAYWILGMTFSVFIMFLFILFSTDYSAPATGTKCAQAFIVAEFSASFEWQLYYFFYMNICSKAGKFGEAIFAIVIYTLVFLVIFLLEKRYLKSNLSLETKWKDFIATVSISIAVFVISNISFVSEETPFSARYTNEIFIVRTLVDFCGVILLYSQQEQRLWLQAKNDLSAMQNLLYRQYEQYCYSKENIELLNRKYHDLKHQIAVIKAEPDHNKKAEYLEELDKGIKRFQAENKTGNKVLDIILTGKSYQCLDDNINFTSVVDGNLLTFMDVMDICSIFGNALDNAIECVKEIKETEKRIIKLAVFSQQELLMIRFENYYEKILKFENGNLKTTKLEKDNHGYGIKSIKSTVEKYGGNLIIDTENNWFKLCILIPIKK